LLRHINPDACHVHHGDALLMVVVGVLHGSGRAHDTQVGESIPLENVCQRRSHVVQILNVGP
jgi:hypothetical protein